MPETSRTTATWRISAAMLLVAAVFFAARLDAPLALAVPLLAVVVTAVRRRPLKVTTRTAVYSLTAAAVVAILGDQLLPVDEARFYLFNGRLVGPLLLDAASALLFLAPVPRVLAGRLAAVQIVMILVTGCSSGPMPPKYMGWLAAALPAGPRTGAAAVVAVLALTLLLVPRIERREVTEGSSARPWRRRRLLLPPAALALAAAGTAALIAAGPLYERFAIPFVENAATRYWLQRGFKIRFGELADMWRNNYFRILHSREPVLRVQGPRPPGYLRVRAYDSYANHAWGMKTSRVPPAPLAESEPLPGERRLSVLRFTRPERRRTGAPDVEYRVYPTDRLAGGVLPVAGGAGTIVISARALSQDIHGSLLAEGWTAGSGYAFVVQAGADAYPLPERVPPECLAVPAAMRDGLQPLLAELDAGAPPASDARRVERTCAWLGDRCAYELNTLRHPLPDPILQFLLKEKRGHCELFASSAVMLLRMQGVPARYVTGFVCEEKAPGGYWISRLKDAHAWAEAWLRDEQRWVLVEATPAAGIPRPDAAAAGFAAWLERMEFRWQRFYTWLKEGRLTAGVIGAVADAWDAVFRFLGDPWRALGTLAVLEAAAILALRWLARRRRGREPSDPARRRLVREWRRVERRLRCKVPVRAPDATPREWAEAAAARCAPEAAAELMGLLVAYEALRYSPAPPPAGAVAEFARRARRLRVRGGG